MTTHDEHLGTEPDAPAHAAVTAAFRRSERAGHRLDSLLAASARGAPDRIALRIGDVAVTYAELFGRAGAVAAELVESGAQPESFVGVGVDRSVESVVGMLGVVLSGAAYVPLDVLAPLARLRQIASQADLRLVTGSGAVSLAQGLGLQPVRVQALAADAPPRTGVSGISVRPDDAAYVLFTSGSTGKPKGVVVSHRAVVSSTSARFGVFPAPMRYLMLAPLTFDAAVAGLYYTLAAGGTLILPTTEEAHDPGLVADLVRRHDASHLDGVPSQYSAILEFHATDLGGLICVIVAGEALSQGLVRRHVAALPQVALYNEYGPTESTVWCTWHRCDAADEGPFAPIGRPVDGMQVHVVDDDVRPVSRGTVGEIAISGRQLARGYLGQPRLTAERFVAHPDAQGERLYLTGDLGRFDELGRLVYCGRRGTMVKVRGFRVELSEVEGWLHAQPDVVDAVVVPEPFADTTRLVAVVVGSAARAAGLPSLRERLAEHLPSYMVPSVWRELERMPLTSHGKIDRGAAAAVAPGSLGRTGDSSLRIVGTDHISESAEGNGVSNDLADITQATRESAPADHATLTRLEWCGLMAEHNLADGHARQGTSSAVAKLVEQLPAVFASAEARLQLDVQRDFERVFYRAAGQPSVLERTNGPLHHYSSSLSIEAVANHLRLEGLRVGLLHPTFDNIPDILHRHHVPVVPVSEEIFARPEDPASWGGFDALFLVTPNNPTGRDPSAETLRRIALECRRQNVLLIIDFSFRFFSEHLHADDTYAFLIEHDVDHIGIEDVGKVWPTLDLKVGSLVCGPRRHEPLRAITDDILLNVSPFVFALMAETGRSDVIEHARQVSTTNRAALVRALAGGKLMLVEGGPSMSVAWVKLPSGWDGMALCDWMQERGVAVLPGAPFFWADPQQGAGFIRIALMRPADAFAAAAHALGRVVAQYEPGDGPARRDGGVVATERS